MATARSEWGMAVHVFRAWRLNEVDGLGSDDGQTRIDEAVEESEGETSVSSQNLPTVAIPLGIQDKRSPATIMQ